MMHAAGWWFASFDCGGQSRQRQPRVDQVADAISDNAPRPGIQDNGNIGKAAADGDVWDVGHPELIGSAGDDGPGEIREDWLIVIAVRWSPWNRRRILG
ncbi:hypothetical protein NKJ76_29710 [Mesorhizobium sp. M0029]